MSGKQENDQHTMELLIATEYPDLIAMIIRLVLACCCGLFIGMERSKRLKEAGIRTHVIACCASALFMLISKYGFSDLSATETAVKIADPARIGAGVVTGISFLCAGVIIQIGGSVHGLTTAVGLWLTAAVGLSIGAGMYGLGFFATILTVAFQFLLHQITFGNDSFHYCSVCITVKSDFDFENIKELILSRTDGVIEDVSATLNKETSVYKFNLRTRETVLTNDWRKMMKLTPSILRISISHSSITTQT